MKFEIGRTATRARTYKNIEEPKQIIPEPIEETVIIDCSVDLTDTVKEAQEKEFKAKVEIETVIKEDIDNKEISAVKETPIAAPKHRKPVAKSKSTTAKKAQKPKSKKNEIPS